MSNSITTLIPGHHRVAAAMQAERPGILGRGVFDDVIDGFFNDSFPRLLKQTTQGYPVTDIYQDEDGNTVMEFALAGFSKEDLSIEVSPEKKAITVAAHYSAPPDRDSDNPTGKRIARRSFEKTYVNYDNNLDLSALKAEFVNGLLRLVVPTRPELKPLTVKIK